MNWELLWDDQFGKSLRLLFNNPGSDIGTDFGFSPIKPPCSFLRKAGVYGMHMSRPILTNKAMYEAT